MRNVIFEIKKNLEPLGVDVAKMDILFPKLVEAVVPLSTTGISARTFAHWKGEGLIDLPDTETRSWVRLNLFQYIWLKIIQVMRNFGLPLLAIKEVKDLLFQETFAAFEKNGAKHYEKFLRDNSEYSDEQIKDQIKLIQEAIHLKRQIPEDQMIYLSLLGSLVSGMLLKNDQVSLTVTKVNDEFEVGMISYKSMGDFSNIFFRILSQPHFQIPLRKLVEDFFNEPKNEKIAESFGLISKNEKRVIDALRNDEYKEIIIKFEDDRKALKIEVIKDGELRDQKVRELMKILGLNEYSEVTLKLRNNKHIYFKNKTRL